MIISTIIRDEIHMDYYINKTLFFVIILLTNEYWLLPLFQILFNFRVYYLEEASIHWSVK